MAATKKSRAKFEEVPVAPDGGYGWIILIACFIISFIVDGCMYSFGIVLSDLREYFRAEQDKANLITSLYTSFLFCSGPIVSGLSNQFGIRAVIMGGAFVTSFTLVISAFVPNIFYVMILYGVIGGFATGCTYISSLIIVAQYFDKKQGMTTGITMAGSGVGAFAFALLTNYLVINYAWKITLVLSGCIFLQCAIMGAFMRPVPTVRKPILIEMKETGDVQKKPSTNEEANLSKVQNLQTFIGSNYSVQSLTYDNAHDKKCYQSCFKVTVNILKEMTDLRLLFQNFPFLLIALSNFCCFTGFFIPYIYIPERAKELKIDNYAWILSIIGLVNIPARICFGTLADKKIISAVNLNTICILITAASLFSYAFLNTLTLQLVFSVTFALGIAGMNCLTTPYLSNIAGMAKFSNSMGIVNLLRGIACFIGPFIGGFVSKNTSVLGAFMFSAICFSAGFLFTLLVSIIMTIKNRREYTAAPTNDS